MFLLAVFVLANYSGNKPTKDSPTEVKAPDTTEGADSQVTWGSRYKNSTFCGCVIVRKSLYSRQRCKTGKV